MKIIYLPDTIRTLVFDIDLTLYDSRPYYDSQINLLIARLAQHLDLSLAETEAAVQTVQARFAQENNGRSLSLGNTFLHFGVDLQTNAQWRADLFRPEDYLQRDEQLVETIEELAQMFAVTAVTNNAATVGLRTLEVLGIKEFFDPVIGLDISCASKPSMAPFQMITQAHGILLAEMVSIGDRMSVDIELPVQNGMGGILVESMADVYRLPNALRLHGA